jgi:hypothetical protein
MMDKKELNGSTKIITAKRQNRLFHQTFLPKSLLRSAHSAGHFFRGKQAAQDESNVDENARDKPDWPGQKQRAEMCETRYDFAFVRCSEPRGSERETKIGHNKGCKRQI